MKISELNTHLANINSLVFQLPDGSHVPAHFHLTEVGLITKDFIDCGGVKRQEKTANLQLWVDTDYDHRMSAEKFLKIINMAQPILGDNDLDIEIEYQQTTIAKFGLAFDGQVFLLTAKKTACLAEDACGIIPIVVPKTSCCSGGACC